MDWLLALFTLTAMEIVLGIDNIVFISIQASKLPVEQQNKARTLGLGAALITRILLLLSISWVLNLTEPVFSLTDLGIPAAWVDGHASAAHRGAPHAQPPAAEGDSAAVEIHDINDISWRDLILLCGGLFLIRQSVTEIHDKISGSELHHIRQPKPASLAGALVQIAILDIIFSLDSVITAVGMAKDIWVMVAAVIAAVGVMMVFSGRISDFVDRNPTVKMLALSFLLLIGVLLVAEGIGTSVNKGYIYFAMAFALLVELLNMKAARRQSAAE